jgi:hypothetical protein
MKRTDKEIEENWEGKWKEILLKEDGTIDVEQLKLELMDFQDLIDKIGTLTCELTRHRLSYPTYPVSTILQVHEECLEEELQDRIDDDKECGVCSFCDQEIEESQ